MKPRGLLSDDLRLRANHDEWTPLPLIFRCFDSVLSVGVEACNSHPPEMLPGFAFCNDKCRRQNARCIVYIFHGILWIIAVDDHHRRRVLSAHQATKRWRAKISEFQMPSFWWRKNIMVRIRSTHALATFKVARFIYEGQAQSLNQDLMSYHSIANSDIICITKICWTFDLFQCWGDF